MSSLPSAETSETSEPGAPGTPGVPGGEPVQVADYAALTSDDLVTGEAVALDLPPAGLAARMASGLIDVVATVVLLFGIALLFLVSSVRTDQAIIRIAMIGTTVVSFVVFPTTFETLTRGRSLGKLAMGLRTVRDDAGPISFQHALVRALIGYVEIYAFTGMPAFFSAMLSQRGKRLGDYAAGTYVVRERMRLRLPLPPQMPPQLAAWASSADIASLPSGLALAVRQFLGRASSFEQVSRHRLGVQLAEQVSAHVAPPPPPGTHPEAFLAAVVAERRARDSARLAREEEFRRRLTG